MRSELLKSGTFAQHANVTKKALQVYMEKGLLIPDYVDVENGYRFFSAEKVAQVDEIVKMRQIGFSLDEIKQIFDDQDALEYLNSLNERLRDVDAQIAEAKQRRDVILSFIDNQSTFLNPPSLRHCFVEYLPERPCVRYPVEPYDARTDGGASWLGVLDMVKQEFASRGVPLMHFTNVGAVFDMDLLREGKLVYTHAIILLKDSAPFPNVEYLPAGYYATMYDQRYMSDGNAISTAAQTILDFIERNGYETRGEYIQHIVAETTMFDFNRLLYIVKEQIPIWVEPRN